MITTEYKVFIPSAGIGTRLNKSLNGLNKALVSVNNKPAISHIIDKFNPSIPIIVAVGHLGDTLIQYLDHAYPGRDITIIETSYNGLGQTMIECKDYLQCPFVFCTNDTIVLEEIPPPDENWMGYSETIPEDEYRTITIDGDYIHEILEKNRQSIGVRLPYIGLAGIKDYKQFWKHLRQGISSGSISQGESYAFRKILKDADIKGHPFTWYDIGTEEKYRETEKDFNTGEHVILPKAHEAIWFVNDRVVKYFNDKDIVTQRVHRATDLKGYVPNILQVSDNMYSYNYTAGKILSYNTTFPVFEKLLFELKTFWTPKKAPSGFEQRCHDFYYKKTKDRIAKYNSRYSYIDKEEKINGITTPKLSKLLDRINWDVFFDAIPVRFHGDLHFGNIILGDDESFILLDWRQNFGDMGIGDVYYDLAKLMHGIIVSHGLINKNMFSIEVDGDMVSMELMRTQQLIDIESRFKQFIIEEGYDLKKVYILTALIYLNIAALHHHPYSVFLYYFGKNLLFQHLGDE